MKTINLRVKKLRNDNKLTQEQMGKILNKKRSCYAHLESYGNFKAAELQILCDYFKIPMSYFTSTELFEKPEPDSIFNPKNVYTPELKLEEPKPDFYKVDTEGVISAKELRIIKFYRSLPKEKREDFFLTLLELFNTD